MKPDADDDGRAQQGQIARLRRWEMHVESARRWRLKGEEQRMGEEESLPARRFVYSQVVWPVSVVDSALCMGRMCV